MSAPRPVFDHFLGIGMVALITAPVMLGGSSLSWSALAAVASILLSGAPSMDEMKPNQGRPEPRTRGRFESSWWSGRADVPAFGPDGDERHQAPNPLPTDG